MVKIKEMTKEQLIQEMTAERYVCLMMMEKDSERLCKLREEVESNKEREKMTDLLEELREVRKIIGKQIEELTDLACSKVSEAELDEDLKKGGV